MNKFLKSKLIFALVAVVMLVTVIAVPLLGGGISSARASGIPTLRSQMTTIATSAPANAVRAQLANLVSDPSLGQWAAELTVQGGTNLTTFQRDLLKAVETESSFGDVLTKLLNGTPLSADDQMRLAALRQGLSNNPAIQLLRSTGAQLKGSSSLAQDISGVVNTLNGPRQTPTPTGDAPRDAVLADISSVINGSAFTTLSSSTIPVLSDSGAPAFVSTLKPEVVATFLPPGQAIALLLPNDRDPFLTPTEKAGLEIIEGIAGYIAVIALAPEELTALALVGIAAGIIAAGAQLITGIADLGEALDCDHDGDPWDPNDTVGIEC